MQASIALLAMVAALPNAYAYQVSFYNQCQDTVSPGAFIQGSGNKDCAPVDSADCMNGYAGDNVDGTGPTEFVCIYAASDCGSQNGFSYITNGASSGHAIVNDGSDVKNILSWGVTDSSNCGPAS